MGSRVAAGVKIFACLLFGCSVVVGFKAHDFKKCNDSSFCSRNRGVKPDPGYALDASSLVVAGATAQAVLLRHLEDGATQKLFLTLTSYGETVRVKVNEEPERRRYEVVDVLLPSVDAMATPWSSWTADATGARLKVGDNTEIVMEFDPFSMEVTVAGESAMEFNRRGMLSMEHKREKKEEDPAGMWEETFNSHKDTKPRGPSAVSFDLSFPKASHVYGLPERATALSLQPTAGEGVDSEPYRLYNLDVFEYLHDSPFGLYGSIPLLMAHRPELTTAAFLLNAAETYVDVAKPEGSGTHTQWISESGVLDLFLMLGPGPGAVLRQYSALTGGTAMPPLFALGYHQCRWNYRDEADVAAVDAGFDEHAMPYDVLWLDIEHTNGKRYMTWDSKLFPDPEKMQRDVASRRRKMVTIVDPHVKRDQNYDLHKEAAAKKFYVRNKDGGDFDGWCWPGSSSYLDVLDPSVRTWWSDRFLPGRYQGATDTLYIWNDMNEPSVFNGPEITMPKDNLHFGDVEHRDVHNVYGLFYHMATADGLRRRGVAAKGSDGDRPFVLSRAFFAGTQRVGPIWTGDNLANWEHLQVSVPMVLTLNLAGLPWSGADVGGFFGNPSEELLTRWYQLGIYYPFFRAHAHLETKRREPWLFGEETSRRIRRALQDRYRLLPYTYTLFRHANLTGQPVMRPLWFDFPRQPQLFAEQQQFMLGPALLVAPALQQGQQQVQIPLPAGTQWYCSVTGERRDTAAVAGVLSLPLDMESIPVLIRGGSIIPQRERPRRSSAAMANDPFTLVVAADGDGRAVGELYLDDGHSFAFQRGVYLHRRFELRPDVDIRSGGRRLVLVNSALPVTGGELPGKMQSELEIERIVVLGMVGNLDKYRPEVAGKPKHTLTAHAGTPSLLHAPQSRHALVLRKPGLKISEDWQINLT